LRQQRLAIHSLVGRAGRAGRSQPSSRSGGPYQSKNSNKASIVPSHTPSITKQGFPNAIESRKIDVEDARGERARLEVGVQNKRLVSDSGCRKGRRVIHPATSADPMPAQVAQNSMALGAPRPIATVGIRERSISAGSTTQGSAHQPWVLRHGCLPSRCGCLLLKIGVISVTTSRAGRFPSKNSCPSIHPSQLAGRACHPQHLRRMWPSSQEEDRWARSCERGIGPSVR
jgi:hypothetical protein